MQRLFVARNSKAFRAVHEQLQWKFIRQCNVQLTNQRFRQKGKPWQIPVHSEHSVHIWCEIPGRQNPISWEPDPQTVPSGRNLVKSVRCYGLNVPMGRHNLKCEQFFRPDSSTEEVSYLCYTFCWTCHFFTGCDAKHLDIIWFGDGVLTIFQGKNPIF